MYGDVVSEKRAIVLDASFIIAICANEPNRHAISPRDPSDRGRHWKGFLRSRRGDWPIAVRIRKKT